MQKPRAGLFRHLQLHPLVSIQRDPSHCRIWKRQNAEQRRAETFVISFASWDNSASRQSRIKSPDPKQYISSVSESSSVRVGVWESDSGIGCRLGDLRARALGGPVIIPYTSQCDTHRVGARRKNGSKNLRTALTRAYLYPVTHGDCDCDSVV